MKLLFASLLVSGLISGTEYDADKACVRSEHVYSLMTDNVVRIKSILPDGSLGVGSGLLVVDGSVVTSTHVIENASRIFVEMPDESILEYVTFGKGSHDSISIIHEQGKHTHYNHKKLFKPAKEISVGESVYTIGFPFGIEKLFSGGYVAAKSGNVIVLSLPSYPGMSGSPVFDCEGKVIGFIASTVKPHHSRRGYKVDNHLMQ